MGGPVESGVQVEPWGSKLEGVLLYTLSRPGMRVCITNWGATIVSLHLLDEQTAVSSSDVVLGFDSIDPYIDGTSPYFGCIVGRVANRIKDATFKIGDEVYHLPANHNSNTLHGGDCGFDKVLWQSRKGSEADNETPWVEFTYHSKDGEQGFPGDLDVSVRYTLLENSLRVDMRAVPLTKPTPVSLAQHTYWNLAGHDQGNILDHTLRLWASHYTPVNEMQIPTGDILPVNGTPFDFCKDGGVQVGSRIEQVEGGYDHNYVVDGWKPDGSLNLVARVHHPGSGRTMELMSNAPGVQVYSGNFLEAVPGKGGCVYRKHAGLCLETQGFPNAVNQANFPGVIISPGQVYEHTMVYKFYKD